MTGTELLAVMRSDEKSRKVRLSDISLLLRQFEIRQLIACLTPKETSGRVYFFAPFSSVYFGYLEGSRKLIYNASSNTAELYDLRADPGEKVNLAPGSPEAVAAGRERLVAWARYQERYYSGLLDRSVR